MVQLMIDGLALNVAMPPPSGARFPAITELVIANGVLPITKIPPPFPVESLPMNEQRSADPVTLLTHSAPPSTSLMQLRMVMSVQ